MMQRIKSLDWKRTLEGYEAHDGDYRLVSRKGVYKDGTAVYVLLVTRNNQSIVGTKDVGQDVAKQVYEAARESVTAEQNKERDEVMARYGFAVGTNSR